MSSSSCLRLLLRPPVPTQDVISPISILPSILRRLFFPTWPFVIICNLSHDRSKPDSWGFLVNDQCDAQILFYVFISIYNSLHVSSTSCSSSGETNCVNTSSGNCHSVSVAVSSVGWEFAPNLHTTRPPTQSDSYQRLYWHNLSLLMMSTMCSKHVESYK